MNTETERFNRAFVKMSLHNAGIRLLPVKSKMSGYYLCQECGAYIQEVGLIERYQRHFIEKHAEKISKSKRGVEA